mgnify:FL=1
MTSPRTTYLVVPAFSDQAGQLRIVSRRASCVLTLTDYRHAPDLWAEAGLVRAHDGVLICLDAPASVHAEFRACEPIRPPLGVCLPDEALT